MAVFKSGGISIPIYLNKASDYDIGESIFIDINGVETEFLVVHKGTPSATLYNGIGTNDIWLMMKDIYETKAMNTGTSYTYAATPVHTYLNSSIDGFLSYLDENVQNVIATVKIPYRSSGTSGNTTVASGSSGLETKIFLPSMYELGFTTSDVSYIPIAGTKLDYFLSGTTADAKTRRIAQLNKVATGYWSRDTRTNNNTTHMLVNNEGTFASIAASNTAQGIRPMLIIKADAGIDPKTHKPRGVLI